MNAFSTGMTAIFALLGALLGYGFAFAADTPYAGQQNRTVKALSDQELSDYVEGRGMGSSKAAELNHYPGPAHVLADAFRLDLSDKQRIRTQSVFDAMTAAAKQSGVAIVAKEAQLDALYASGKAEPIAVKALVTELSCLQSEFRYAHLGAHLAMRTILTPEQITAYDEMRGYTTTVPHSSPETEAAPVHQHTYH